MTLLSKFTVVEEEKRLGVPGEERRATMPSPSVGNGRRAFVSDPAESTSVVAAADAEATSRGRRRPRREREPVMVKVKRVMLLVR